MRERPILFSAPMVRALLAGTKTQTRRVVKPVGDLHPGHNLINPKTGQRGVVFCQHSTDFESCDRRVVRPCPYGQPGDRLWVRETWATTNPKWRAGTRSKQPGMNYRATDEIGPYLTWRPSIFMPRWACRLELELTQVRVERLQDISEEDAKAEGCTGWKAEHWSAYDPKTDAYPEFFVKPGRTDLENLRRHPDTEVTAAERFRILWDPLNAKRGYGWDSNPWVWALTFKRAEAKERAA